MPDRSAAVKRFYDLRPGYFVPDMPLGHHDDQRRQSLPVLIAYLEVEHPEDESLWGVLVKANQNLKIPCDIIVWAPTLEHVDISTSSGGSWEPHGPITNASDQWHWAPSVVVDLSGHERALAAPPYPMPTPLGGGSGGGGTSPAPPNDDLRDLLTAYASMTSDGLNRIDERLNALEARAATQHHALSDTVRLVGRISDTLDHVGLEGKLDLPGSLFDGRLRDLKRRVE